MKFEPRQSERRRRGATSRQGVMPRRMIGGGALGNDRLVGVGLTPLDWDSFVLFGGFDPNDFGPRRERPGHFA